MPFAKRSGGNGNLGIPSFGLLPMHRGAELYPDGLLRKHVVQRNANDRFFPLKGEANKAELFNYLIINYSVK